MRFEETNRPNKYECYKVSSNGNYIAKCVISGAFMLTFSAATPRVYAAPSPKATCEWIISSSVNNTTQIESHVSEPLVEAYKLPYFVKIEDVGLLPQNWNGCGAEKPNQDAVRNAKHLIEVLDKNTLKNLQVDDIYASDYGSVILDFETQKGVVSVEMGDKSMGYYTDFTDGKNYAAEGISTDFVSVPKTLEYYLS